MNTMIALMKRELWEHKSFYWVPGIMAVLIFAAFLWGMGYVMPMEVGYEEWVAKMMDSDTEALAHVGANVLPGLAAPFFVMMAIVSAFYLLDSLYAERRDRSILFWKSLPVTDAQTVASKWLSVLVTFPALVLAAVFVLSFLMSLFTGFFVMAGGGSAWDLIWKHVGLFSGLYHTVIALAVTLLWYLPVMAWLMLASAWAKKAPFLWATLPWLGLVILEEMFFDTNNVLHLLGDRLTPFSDGMESFGENVESFGDNELRLFGGNLRMSGDVASVNWDTVAALFTSAGFWVGLIFAAACTAGAIWLRRYRDES